ncbi:hypothetical protein BC351_01010 [Paenibacillus ferrarius]|uniref:DUF4230 domain-containing protein n=1 Tax=Paenibacillus ferrarius TaxID=1469647 RepID=A0A1V4HSP8_9BACL|nr:DUF4230 domain-containing protein [Paenibacillus ferrarius]OPH61852.1 hypothetical protein BC351_01010 [Paenibacillus ferrarius]
MIVKHLYKHRKLFATIIVVTGVTYFVSNLHLGGGVEPEVVHHAYTGLNHIEEADVIDKNVVIKAIHSKSELVGLDTHGLKTYIVSDSFFQNHGSIKDYLGNRTLEIIAQTYFKTGIDLSSIHNEDVVVYGQTLFLKLSKSQMQMISLDIPFDQIQFNTKLGLFRSNFSLEDKQFLYSELRKSVENEIMNNEIIRENTYKNVSDTLRNLLEKIPNCTKVVIQEKIT